MKLIKRTIILLFVFAVIFGLSYAWRALPIISGYGAKILCSCTFVAGRDAENVIAIELGRSPLSLGTYTVSYTDSSASGNVFGLASKKAIFRKGLGCTLINEIAEEELRAQPYHLASSPALNPDTIPWPMGNLLPDSLPAGINYDQLNQVVSEAFEEPGPNQLRRTRAILVLYDGQIVAEKYGEGFDQRSRLIGWSMTKSITNALVGILIKEGKLELHQPAPVPIWKDDERSNITLNNLLHASSGLRWEENYGGPSGATNMLFKKKDMGLYAASFPLQHEPESTFYYSSGTTNLISWIIRKTVGDDNYYSFPSEKLFHKLGMYSIVLEPDAGGTFVGSSYSFATARDWARFGLLYYNKGKWNGEEILPASWIAYSTTPAPAAPLGEYGAQFWLNAGAPDDASRRIYPDVPADLYWADGFEGQNVFILPSKKLVVVKLSLSHGDYLDDNVFLSKIIETLP